MSAAGSRRREQEKALNAYCAAVDQHDLGTIVEMVSQKTVDVNTETYSGDTALTMVAWWGERAVLKLLINAGASVSRETSRGATALSEAARGGHLDCARVLVAAGVDMTDLSSMNETIINRLLSDWSTELSDSEHAKRHEVLDWLIKGGVDIHNETDYGSCALTQAAAANLAEVVDVLIRCGARVNHATFRETPLMSALTANAMDTAELLIARGADVNLETLGGQLPLTWACAEGDLEMVNFLIKHGADVERRTKNYSRAALVAASQDQPDMLEVLAEAGADLFAENELNVTPLVAAARANASNAIAMLVKAGVNVNALSQASLSPLMEATQFQVIDAMQQLMLAGADPNLESSEGVSTALMQAVKAKSMEAVQCLMKHGAKPAQVVSDGESAIIVGIVTGDPEILYQLLQGDVMAYLKANKDKLSTLALDMGQPPVISVLEAAFAHVHAMEEARALQKQRMQRVHGEYYTVIMEKIAHGWGAGLGLGEGFLVGTLEDKIEKCLFDQAVRIILFGMNEVKQRLEEEEKQAARQRSQSLATEGEWEEGESEDGYASSIDEELQAMLEEQAAEASKPVITPDFEAPGGYTTLMRAAGRGNLEAMERMVEIGADVNYVNRNGTHTALTWASSQGQIAAVKLLLQMGANPNMELKPGTTALIEAVYWNHAAVTKALIRAGAEVNFQTTSWRVALHEACNRNNAVIIKLLLQGQADPNLESAAGFTPLMIAARRGSVAVADLLIQYKAVTRAMNKLGHNALYEARKFGQSEVVEMLLKVSCLDKVDKAIREWEHGHLLHAFRRWVENAGVVPQTAEEPPRVRRIPLLVPTADTAAALYGRARAVGNTAVLTALNNVKHKVPFGGARDHEMRTMLNISQNMVSLSEVVLNAHGSDSPVRQKGKLQAITFTADSIARVATGMIRRYVELISVYCSKLDGAAPTKAAMGNGSSADDSAAMSLYSGGGSTPRDADVLREGEEGEEGEEGGQTGDDSKGEGKGSDEEEAVRKGKDDDGDKGEEEGATSHADLTVDTRKPAGRTTPTAHDDADIISTSLLSPMVQSGTLMGFSEFTWGTIKEQHPVSMQAKRHLQALLDNVEHYRHQVRVETFTKLIGGRGFAAPYNGLGVFAAMSALRYLLLSGYVDDELNVVEPSSSEDQQDAQQETSQQEGGEGSQPLSRKASSLFGGGAGGGASSSSRSHSRVTSLASGGAGAGAGAGAPAALARPSSRASQADHRLGVRGTTGDQVAALPVEVIRETLEYLLQEGVHTSAVKVYLAKVSLATTTAPITSTGTPAARTLKRLPSTHSERSQTAFVMTPDRFLVDVVELWAEVTAELQRTTTSVARASRPPSASQ